MTTLRELWDSGRPTVGGWCVMPGSFSAELMGRSGFDWVCLASSSLKTPTPR